jgi:dihydroorotase
MDYLITNVSILGGEPTDMLVRDGLIAAIGPLSPDELADELASGDDRVGTAADASEAREASEALEAVEVIDGTGLVALPGLVDLHTHLREPGREDAETVLSGSRAAALGGYTAVCAMANTSPAADTAGVVEQVYRLGREAGLVDVQPIGAVTVGLAGEALAELGTMATSAAHVRIFSDDGHCVSDPQLMRRALEYVTAFDGVIAQHAEEPRLTAGAQMHEGDVSARLGLAGWPAVAEEAIIARDALLAGHVGARLHICHVSTAGSVEIIRWAKARGIRITAEVTPHHLLLTDELVAGDGGLTAYDPVFKVNPPLRTKADVEALRAALIEGVIDVVATDHAPHATEDKECEWAYARPGMLGLETALSIVAETCMGDGGRSPGGLDSGGLDSGGLDWDGIADRMSRAPARIAGLGDHGHDPAVGAPATFILVDPGASRVIDPKALASKSRNTPYVGMRLPLRVVATFLRGVPTVLDGALVPTSPEVAA